MKKTILLLLLCCSAYTLFAQDSDTMKTTKVKMKMKPRQNDHTPGNTMNKTMSTTNSSTTTVVLTTEWKVDPSSLPVIGSDVPADVVINIKNN